MVWDATNIFLFAANILTVLYILYNDAVIPLWKGKTVLGVKLRSRGRWDGYIFVGIIVLLFVSNTFFREGPFFHFCTAWDYGCVIHLYLLLPQFESCFQRIRTFLCPVILPLCKIERMNLSEDGVLVIETNRQRLMLFARSEKDLEKMLAVFTTYS